MIHTLFSTKKKYAKIQTIFLRPPISSSRNHLQALKVLLKLSPQCKFNLTAPFPKGHSPSNSDMMISQNRIEPELLQFSVASRYHIGGGLKISWHVKSEKLFISQDREQRSGTIIRSKGQYQGLWPKKEREKEKRGNQKYKDKESRPMIRSRDQEIGQRISGQDSGTRIKTNDQNPLQLLFLVRSLFLRHFCFHIPHFRF